MFIDSLIEAVQSKNNPTVVGLDPKLDFIPEKILRAAYDTHGETLEGAAAAIVTFNRAIIDAVADVVPAVKPQLAYYEMYGVPGLVAYTETCRYAREKGLLVIADGKRNDIGATAEAYAAAHLGKTKIGGTEIEAFPADALTVNAYLGSDGIKPFVDACQKYGKGIFALVKTSNPSSGQLQDRNLAEGDTVYNLMAALVDTWGENVCGKYGYSSVGAVVGATYPEQASTLRSRMKRAYILVPGYGAQGGTAADAANSFNEDGLGAIVNASRSMMCAWKAERWNGRYKEDDFAEAARAEAIRMRDDLNAAITIKIKGC